MAKKKTDNSKIPVTCRPAKQSDTTQVMALTKLIWDGDDYVPHAWADWLADTQGLLGVAEYAGQLIALGKLTRLSEHDWWLEGMRVHPDYEGRGVASQLNAYLLAYWEREGTGKIRLATSSKSEAVHRICAHNGFHKGAEYTTYKAPTLDSGNDFATHFRPVLEEDLSRALSTIQNSPALALQEELLDLGWQWAPPREAYLLESIQADQIWWWRNGDGLLAVSEFDDEKSPTTLVRGLACQLEDLPDLLLDYRRLAGLRGRAYAKWHAPVAGETRSYLEAAGFTTEPDHSFHIFERSD